MKGVSRFGRVSTLSPRYVGPFEILERIGKSAYKLLLSDQMSDVHNVFHVSTLRMWISDSEKKFSADEAEIQENLQYKEEPELILAYDVCKLRSKQIHMVKVQWKHRTAREATWEKESDMRQSYLAREGEQDKDDQRAVPNIETLFRRFWKVASPYWSSEDKIQARLKLAAVFALTLGTTGISVGFNFLGRDFYNALANKDQEQFTKQLLYYLGAFAGGIPIFVLRDYAKDTLSLRWRSWMTSYYLERYLKNRTFYKIQSQSIIDNPDQRIVDDLSSFTGTALAFSLTVFNAAVDLISFSNILYGIYPPLFVVLIVYSLGGTAVSVFLGKGLVNLNFMQEKKEADFRYALVRVRENAESIAFYGGEKNEKQLLLDRFKRAFENLSQLLISSRNLEFFTSGYRYLIQILPAAVVAPMYFSGKIEFGVINQSVSAFNHILSDFSLIVYQFQSISAFSAIIDRLGEFDDVLDAAFSNDLKSDDSEEIIIHHTDLCVQSSSDCNGSIPQSECQKLLEVYNLTLQTPRSGTILIKGLSFVINEGDHLLITGPSGSGKTSFLRALAGLWTSGQGNITFYGKDSTRCQTSLSSGTNSSPQQLSKDDDLQNKRYRRDGQVFFLPQRPYMALGTLRQQLLYPTWSENSLPVSTNSGIAGMLAFILYLIAWWGVTHHLNDQMTSDRQTNCVVGIRASNLPMSEPLAVEPFSNDLKSDDSEEIIIHHTDLCVQSSSDCNGSIPQSHCQKLLEVYNLTLQTPRSGTILIKGLSFVINEGDHLLITGPSGSGKTSFLRALAGLWTSGQGNITFYGKDSTRCETSLSSGTNSSPQQSSKDDDLQNKKYRRAGQVFFLPQRPYMALGTLRQQLLYPTWSENSLPVSTNSGIAASSSSQNNDMPSTEDLVHVLNVVSLSDILSRFQGLDCLYEWSSVLSLGEQQRLAFARLLLAKPNFVLLDESTSALDEANEAHLYKQIEAAGITYISIGHRSTLFKYHSKVLKISKFDHNNNQQNWQLWPISKATKPQSIPAS
ncbi:ABC transporter D family member 2, chloroplastic-like [Dendrobium catenatum]|uniref:ABC transporter D family member 2, chloroplastic-like n=1 Tax=Dendrobium catenatum TaxID=906689 RepID=UPI00109F1173|nr:ABC transporter D family member 2, chloroplastic-like [Dendrobium catenatum]